MKLYQRLALTAASALMIVAIFPRIEAYPLAWVALVPALVAIKGATAKQAFWLGFLLNFIHKAGSNYWLVFTISYYGEFPHPYLVAVTVFILLLGALGFLIAWPWYLLGRAVNELKVPLFLAAPVAWVLWELIITVFLGGFPWVLYGYSQYPDLYARQFTEVLSVYGLSFFLVMVNAALAESVLYFMRNRQRFPTVPLIASVLIVVGIYAYGFIRVPQIRQAMAGQQELKVGVVQGNIDQFDKRRGDRRSIMNKYKRLSLQAAANEPDLIIWPETSVPGKQNQDKPPRASVVSLVQDVGVPMLLGVSVKYYPVRNVRFNYNSAKLYSADGKLLGTCYKNHMVPFGEWVPMREWLEVVAPEQSKRTMGYSPRGKFNIIEPAPGPFAVIICYEAIYPATNRRLANMGVDYIINITNDAWFGDTSAPRQHLKMTAYRAIENRRWIARAANTGISAVIDPLGNVITMTPYRVDARFTDTIGRLRIRTPYQVVGNVLPCICGILSLLAVVVLAYRSWRFWGFISALGLAGAGLAIYFALGPSQGILVLGVGFLLVQRARHLDRGRIRTWIAFSAVALLWPFFGWMGWGIPFALAVLVLEVPLALLLGLLIRRNLSLPV